MSSLKDLYENPELEEEESEQDSDFVPEDNDESEDQEIEDSEEDEEEEVTEKVSTSVEEDKKSKIDAIWADMNNPSKVKKITQEIKPAVIPEPSPDVKRKLSLSIGGTSTNKRPKSNLNSLMNKYKIKEPKLNTLEKSKLDWQGYVKKEGIEDELKYKNKDGYMEKVAFLNRVDDRRLSQLKQGQNKKK